MSETEKHDPSERRRRALLGATMVLIMAAFAAAEVLASHEGRWRWIDWIRVGAILVLAFMLSLRSTTSLTLKPRDPALDDELTRANRASAAVWGFWALFASLVAAFALTLVWPLGVAEIAPMVLVLGTGAASLRFIYLERQGA